VFSIKALERVVIASPEISFDSKLSSVIVELVFITSEIAKFIKQDENRHNPHNHQRVGVNTESGKNINAPDLVKHISGQFYGPDTFLKPDFGLSAPKLFGKSSETSNETITQLGSGQARVRVSMCVSVCVCV
jgi:hypothetical protein